MSTFVALDPLAAARFLWWVRAHPDRDAYGIEVDWGGHSLREWDAVRFLWCICGQEDSEC